MRFRGFCRLVFFGLILCIRHVRGLAEFKESVTSHFVVIVIRDGDRLGFPIIEGTAPSLDNLTISLGSFVCHTDLFHFLALSWRCHKTFEIEISDSASSSCCRRGGGRQENVGINRVCEIRSTSESRNTSTSSANRRC